MASGRNPPVEGRHRDSEVAYQIICYDFRNKPTIQLAPFNPCSEFVTKPRNLLTKQEAVVSEVRRSAMPRILKSFLDVRHHSPTYCGHDPRITVALRLLNSESGLSLEQIARKVNLSDSRLRHVIREELGVAPHRYVKQLRLRRARALVVRTFLSVKEIASAAGFGDISHFARDYRAAFGETASQTRRRVAVSAKR